MFCRNCGKELAEASELCSNCRARPAVGTGFCPSCGAPTTPITEICPKCGARVSAVVEDRTWMPTVAGILMIISGVVHTIGGLVIAVWVGFWGAFLAVPWLGALGVPLLALGIVALLGGIYALRRRVWGLALAGSVCVLIVGNLVFGVLSLVFVIMAKNEFE